MCFANLGDGEGSVERGSSAVSCGLEGQDSAGCVHELEMADKGRLDSDKKVKRETRKPARLLLAEVLKTKVALIGRLPEVNSELRGKSNSQRPGHVAWTREFGGNPWDSPWVGRGGSNG